MFYIGQPVYNKNDGQPYTYLGCDMSTRDCKTPFHFMDSEGIRYAIAYFDAVLYLPYKNKEGRVIVGNYWTHGFIGVLDECVSESLPLPCVPVECVG